MYGDSHDNRQPLLVSLPFCVASLRHHVVTRSVWLSEIRKTDNETQGARSWLTHLGGALELHGDLRVLICMLYAVPMKHGCRLGDTLYCQVTNQLQAVEDLLWNKPGQQANACCVTHRVQRGKT